MRFVVRDMRGKEMPNVGIEVRSAGMDETIFTGLKPERGIGYADLDVTPGTFSLALLNAALESPVQFPVGAAPVDCALDRGATPRGWKVVLQQK
jgi:hypothetical protein